MSNLQNNLRYQKNVEITRLEITQLANDLLDTVWKISVGDKNFDINLSKIDWTFSFNNKRSAIGMCTKFSKEIFISEYWFHSNTDMSAEWEDVLRHEIAHALDHTIRDTSDHSKVWRNIAEQVLADPRSTTGNLKSGVSRYLRVCPNCHKAQPVHKRTKKRSACGDCCRKYNNNKFSSKYVLELIINPEYNQLKKEIEAERIKKVEEPTKVCKDCGESKSLSEYHKDSKSKDGCIPRCKSCYTIWNSSKERLRRKNK